MSCSVYYRTLFTCRQGRIVSGLSIRKTCWGYFTARLYSAERLKATKDATKLRKALYVTEVSTMEALQFAVEAILSALESSNT